MLTLLVLVVFRYAINDAAVDWSTAEEQVKALASGGSKGASTVVSFKATAASTATKGDGAPSGQKRKASEGGAGGGSDGKKNRRSKKVKR